MPRPRGGIIPAGDGRFVVLTPSMIALYSPGFELLKDFKLSPEQRTHLWDFHASPSGKSILVEYHYPEANYQWLDSDTLQPHDISWSDSLPVLSISDELEIASFRDTYVKAKGTNVFEALVQPRSGAERIICRVLAGHGESCGDPEFLSNGVLALLAPHGFNLVPSGGGDVFLKADFHEDEWLDHSFHTSSDGKRFAVTLWKHKGGSALFDISSHSVLKRIVIYDLSTRQAIYTLDAKQQQMSDVSGAALSPDGSLMAILTDGIVEVYRLPLQEQ